MKYHDETRPTRNPTFPPRSSDGRPQIRNRNDLQHAMDRVEEDLYQEAPIGQHQELIQDVESTLNVYGKEALKDRLETVPRPSDMAESRDILGRNRVIGLKNANSDIGVNPKDRIGAAKVDFTLIPTSAKIALALALMDGATKYGPYNWRVEPVQFRTYLGAAERHLEDVKEGEEIARDSLVEHLGHVMACCAILIDAHYQGKLVDDRPINGQGADLIEMANEFIKTQKPEGWGR